MVGQGEGLSAGRGRGGCALQNAGVGGLVVSSQRCASSCSHSTLTGKSSRCRFAVAHSQPYLCPHLGLPTEKVTCVLCGCREGRWRNPNLPGLTVDFLRGVSGGTTAGQSSFISLCWERGYAGSGAMLARTPENLL